MKVQHTYERQGPFIRARVVIYGRTEVEAFERARSAVQTFGARLPMGVNCWAPAYEGFDPEQEQHRAAFSVAFGISEEDQTREQIDGLVAEL